MQVVFYGLSGAFLLIGVAAMIGNLSDTQDRSILRPYEWSNRRLLVEIYRLAKRPAKKIA